MDIILFIWDSWNTTHIKRKGVMYQEVEEVFQHKKTAFRNYNGRIALIGKTKADRTLAVILENTNKRGAYYVIAARDTSQKEYRLYHEWKNCITAGKVRNQIPYFKTREEEAQWWDTHDITGYLHELRPISITPCRMPQRNLNFYTNRPHLREAQPDA